MDLPPLLANKHADSPSVFIPSTLLREARRQKGIAAAAVPSVCVLDPDGDLGAPASRVQAPRGGSGIGPAITRSLTSFRSDPFRLGIVGRVVGASFAVLVAEELFASGCELLISLTSAGQISPAGDPPYFVVIDRALRDEGTSYHYAPPSVFADGDPRLVAVAGKALAPLRQRTVLGASWTTDAPFRETSEAIEAARTKNILCVEMEAAALYAFARAKKVSVLCLAHVTNTMGQFGTDFEKGEADGTSDALEALERIVTALRDA